MVSDSCGGGVVSGGSVPALVHVAGVGCGHSGGRERSTGSNPSLSCVTGG